MNITGAVRKGSEFQLTAKPHCQASSTFAVITTGEIFVSRTLTDILKYSDDSQVLAHWHGSYRTEGFATTVGELRILADKFPKQ